MKVFFKVRYFTIYYNVKVKKKETEKKNKNSSEKVAVVWNSLFQRKLQPTNITTQEC